MAVPVVLACVATAACGGSSQVFPAPEAPVGKPVLPDLAPAPPQDIQLRFKNGRWNLRFSSILVNIGQGAFVLRVTRKQDRPWHVEQDVPYSASGAKATPVDAEVVWGGDGHNHWHIKRVAKTWLVPLAAGGQPETHARRLIDAKIGFCFYDLTHLLLMGPHDAVYSRKSCGNNEDNTSIGMGLSPGWVDTYAYALPGQLIDITDVPDGDYRLYDSVDEAGWFHETRRSNNVSWANIALGTKANGERMVKVTNPGPAIRGPNS
jgi:hypothetical protein